MVMKAGYPVFDRNAYFSPNRIIGEDFGLNYDYYTRMEHNFTYGSYRVSGTVEEYNMLRTLIEALPELQQYEMRAFCCVPWDDAGTSIAFAMVISSAYSRSAPTGNPKAMRDTFIPKGFISFVRYKLVASPSTEGFSASIISFTSF